MKNLYIICTILLIFSCKNQSSELLRYQIQGETMGTYYKITYYATQPKIDQVKIDQRLIEINQELSTYIPTSTISMFNTNVKRFINPIAHGELTYPLFDKMFTHAKEVYLSTNGYFDPTVMPLVNYWGFGYKKRNDSLLLDSSIVHEIKQYVGFNQVIRKVYQDSIVYIKQDPRTQLDFSANAKGYGVDLIGKLLETYKINNYLIDIGGENLARGSKPDGVRWKIGISRPDENADIMDFVVTVSLYNQAMAGSGNYRNFYNANGQKYSHTINPITGFTERNTLLGVSVIARDCSTADAYATASMVLGPTKAKKLINKKDGLEACFIINKNGHLAYEYSDGFLKTTQKSDPTIKH